VHLIDFSEARVFHTQSRLSDRMCGTPAYSSPEQSGLLNRPIDFRSDLYNAGVMFYWMLTGSVPYKQQQGGSLLDLVHAHISVEVPKVRSVRADVPVGVACVVEKLLQKDPSDRFQSACGLWKQLLAIRDATRRDVTPTRSGDRPRGDVFVGDSACDVLDPRLVKMSQMLHIGECLFDFVKEKHTKEFQCGGRKWQF
jgi:serine/threonine protein kinase